MDITVIWRSKPHSERVIEVSAEPYATVGDLADALSSTKTDESGSTIRVADASVHGVQGQVFPRSQLLSSTGLVAGTTIEVFADCLQQAADEPGGTRLRIEGPGQLSQFHSIAGPVVSVGSAPDCDVVVPHAGVESVHAWVDIRTAVMRSASDEAALMVDDTWVFKARLEPGARIGVGSTTVSLVQQDEEITLAGSQPYVTHIVQPTFVPALVTPEVTLPQAPSQRSSVPFPLLMLIAPVIVASLMFMVTRSSFVLVFAIFMPVLALGNYLSQRRNATYSAREAHSRFEQAADRLLLKAHEFHDQERNRANILTPAAGDMWMNAKTRGPQLWASYELGARPWGVRIGTGRRPSALVLESPLRSETEGDVSVRLEDLAAEVSTLNDAPLTVDLSLGPVGIVGEEDQARSVTLALLLTLACTYSPEDMALRMCLRPGSRAVAEAVSCLPHFNAMRDAIPTRIAIDDRSSEALVSELERLVADRSTSTTEEGTPRICVLVEAPVQQKLSSWIALTRHAAAHGVTLVWWAHDTSLVPSGCTTVVNVVDQGHGDIRNLASGCRIDRAELTTVDVEEARNVARHLAPVTDARAREKNDYLLPAVVSLAEAASLPSHDLEREVSQRWNMSDGLAARDLRATVGMDPRGFATISLVADGPHALVAGTTGSGKSELLRSWVLALAAEYSPRTLTFLFIDYKGGAAFHSCTELPHCVGLVTDLSGSLVTRALTSLRAELHRREEILARAGVKDIASLAAIAPTDCPPSLVIVVDEFAALARETPHFVDELIDIAARGRSLGLHLILATQRPAGVVSDRIRANASLRIALRLADRSDSFDVLGTGEAAEIHSLARGRGFIRRGAGAPTEVQVAYSGFLECTEDVPAVSVKSPAWDVERLFGQAESAVSGRGSASQAQTDAERVVSAACAVMTRDLRPMPRRPWLQPLQSHYSVRELNQRNDPKRSGRRAAATGTRRMSAEAHAIGLVDLPARQRQQLLKYSPVMHPRLLIMGRSDTGRELALNTILAVLRDMSSHAYIIDAGGFAHWAEHAFVGAVIPSFDTDRVMRLVRTLRALMEQRLGLKRRTHASTFEELQSAVHGGLAATVVIIESYAACVDGLGPRDIADASAVLSSIAREGASLGISLIIGCDRPREVPTVLDALIDTRLIFSLSSADDEALMGLPNMLAPERPCGRALAIGWEETVGSAECQIATADLADASPSGREQTGGVDKSGFLLPIPIHSFPDTLTPAQLPPSPPGQCSIGVDWDRCAPVDLALTGTLLVLSTPAEREVDPLRTCVAAARGTHRIIVLSDSPDDHQGSSFAGDVNLRVDDVGSLAKELDFDSQRPVLLVIPSCGGALLHREGGVIAAAIETVVERGGMAIGKVDSHEFSRTHPVVTALLRHGRGIVQGTREATAMQTFHVHARCPSITGNATGRGWLVDQGKATFLHLVEP